MVVKERRTGVESIYWLEGMEKESKEESEPQRLENTATPHTGSLVPYRKSWRSREGNEPTVYTTKRECTGGNE